MESKVPSLSAESKIVQWNITNPDNKTEFSKRKYLLICTKVFQKHFIYIVSVIVSVNLDGWNFIQIQWKHHFLDITDIYG